MGLSTVYKNTITSTLSDGTLNDPARLASQGTISDGSGHGQADLRYTASRTLAPGATDNYDLSDNSLKDSFGKSISMERLKVVCVVNNSEDPSCDLLVLFWGGDEYQANLIDIVVQPTGEVRLTAPQLGYQVIRTLHDHFTITNNGHANATYSLLLIGAS